MVRASSGSTDCEMSADTSSRCNGFVQLVASKSSLLPHVRLNYPTTLGNCVLVVDGPHLEARTCTNNIIGQRQRNASGVAIVGNLVCLSLRCRRGWKSFDLGRFDGYQ